MRTKAVQPPPCLVLRVPRRTTAPTRSPAFGLIPTYSHRIPPRKDDSNHDKSDEEEGPLELVKVAAATVFKSDLSSKRTPLSIEDPVVCRKALPRRKPGSTSSTLSSSRDVRPCSISLSHCAVSKDSLLLLKAAAGESPPLALARPLSHVSSTTTTNADDSALAPTSITPVLPPTAAAAKETAAAVRLKRLYLCPWESTDPAPTWARTADESNDPSLALTRPPSDEARMLNVDSSMAATKPRTNDDDDDKLEKIRTARSRSKRSQREQGRGGAGGIIVSNDSDDKMDAEPATPPLPRPTEFGSSIVIDLSRYGKERDEGIDYDRVEQRGRNATTSVVTTTRARNVYFLKLGIVTVLTMALMIDLVVINVKLFTREDWE